MERLWCTACGTVTSDMLCDCNRWPGDTQEPHFVNYADAMQETAHKQAQQIEVLVKALEATDFALEALHVQLSCWGHESAVNVDFIREQTATALASIKDQQ